MKKLCVGLLAVAFLSACSDSTLWEEAADQHDSKDTRIVSVKRLRETCNAIVLEVTYYNAGGLPGYLQISSNAGIPGQMWPMPQRLLTGRHTVEVENGFQSKATPVDSHELTFAMEQVVDNHWKGYIDRHSVKYEKHWDNSCQ